MPRGGQACNFSRREEGGGLVEPPRSLLKVDGLADPTIMQCYIHVDCATDSSCPKLGRQPQGVGREENRACPQHLRSTRTRHTDAPAGFNLTFFSRPSVQNTTKRSQTMKTETWVMPNPPYAISRTKAPEVRRAESFCHVSVCTCWTCHVSTCGRYSKVLSLSQSAAVRDSMANNIACCLPVACGSSSPSRRVDTLFVLAGSGCGVNPRQHSVSSKVLQDRQRRPAAFRAPARPSLAPDQQRVRILQRVLTACLGAKRDCCCFAATNGNECRWQMHAGILFHPRLFFF